MGLLQNQQMQTDKPKILFLCTGNSCRSQMAEALSNILLRDQIQAYSAGIIAKGLDPLAIEVLQDLDIDISNHHSKTIDEVMDIKFDFVITVCDHAAETCPYFPTQPERIIRHAFDDPPKLSQGLNHDEAIKIYRRVRDEIKNFVIGLPVLLERTKEKISAQ